MTFGIFRQLYMKLQLQIALLLDQETDKEKRERLLAYQRDVLAFTSYLEETIDRQETFDEAHAEEMKKKLTDIRVSLNHNCIDYRDFYQDVGETLSSIETVVTGTLVDKKETLEQLICKASDIIVSLNANPDSVGAVSSTRYMMKVKNADGTETEGFFSPDSPMLSYDIHGTVEKLLDEAIAKHPGNQNLKRFVDAVKKSAHGSSALPISMLTKKDQADREESINNARDLALISGEKYTPPKTLDGYSPYAFDRLGITKDGSELSTEHLKTDKDIAALLKKVRGCFTEADVARIGIEFSQYSRESKDGIGAIKGSTRVGRNVAVTKIAALLGVSDHIAKSKAMTAEFRGRLYQGMFMEKGAGQVFPSQAKDYLDSPFEKLDKNSLDGEILEQLAAIQVVDYVCQNVDHHLFNFLFTTQDNKITKVVAFDNDLSFGTKKAKENRSFQHGVSINDIMVIPKAVADAISKLRPETVMSALLDTGLSTEEIRAAGSRFYRLKNHIRDHKAKAAEPIGPGKVKVISDWTNMKLEDLNGDFVVNDQMQRNTSIFAAVSELIVRVLNFKQIGRRRKMIEAREERIAEDAERARKLALGQKVDKEFAEGENLELLSETGLLHHKRLLTAHLILLNRTEQRHSTTEKYRLMKNALLRLAIKTPTASDDFETRTAYEKLLADAMDKVTAYIQYKEPQNDTGYAGSTRLKEAKALSVYLKTYKEKFENVSREAEEQKLDEAYRQYYEERKAINAKLDTVVGTLAHSLMEGQDAKEIAAAEETIRNGKTLQRMFALYKGPDDGFSAVSHYADLAESDPKALKDLYVSLMAEKEKKKEDKKEEKKEVKKEIKNIRKMG